MVAYQGTTLSCTILEGCKRCAGCHAFLKHEKVRIPCAYNALAHKSALSQRGLDESESVVNTPYLQGGAQVCLSDWHTWLSFLHLLAAGGGTKRYVAAVCLRSTQGP